MHSATAGRKQREEDGGFTVRLPNNDGVGSLMLWWDMPHLFHVPLLILVEPVLGRRSMSQDDR
jgi:hypothetical protein